MKKLTAFLAVIVLTAAVALAGSIALLDYSGDPNGTLYSDRGQVVTDTANSRLWLKTTAGTLNTGWVQYNADALGNAVRGTVTVTTGTGVVTNSAFTTNSAALLTASGTVTPSSPYRVQVASGTATVFGGTNTTTATYLIFNP